MTTQNQSSIESKIIARALKDEAFKQQLLNNSAVAKAEIEKELGVLPKDFKINVVQESSNTVYIVLPYMPSSDAMTEEQLEFVAGGGINISPPCHFGSATITAGV